MARRPRIVAAVSALLAAALLLGAGGCGEKIAIPQPVGVFSLLTYSDYLVLDDDDPRQLIQVGGSLFVVAGDALVKRDLLLAELGRVGGLADPQALCWDAKLRLVYVWEQGTHTLHMYTADLQEIGAVVLAEPVDVVAMAASPRGTDEVPGAESFLYLADPAGNVVHRYAADGYGGMVRYGALARGNGNSLRDVRVAAGLTRDGADHILACDIDSLRHWVIRFDPTPDESDGDRRGVAVVYAPYTLCPTPAANEYALGNAPGCNQTDWVPGPMDTTGVFDTPTAATVDGAGRIFVADSGNNRFQVFGFDDRLIFGHLLTHRDDVTMQGPTSIATFDYRWGGAADSWFYGALVFVVLPDAGQIRSFISQDYDNFLNTQPRPPE